MARAGGGGGSRSGGGHSSSRSGGGHQMGGSSRAGSGFGGGRPGGGFNGAHGFPGGGQGGHPMNTGPGMWGGGFDDRRRRQPGFWRGRPGGMGCGCGSVAAIVLVVILLYVFIFPASSTDATWEQSADIPSSTVNREKISTGIAFDSDCVIDELGWFDSVSKTGKELKTFYEKTGIQPYVYFRAYDASLTSDSEKLAFAESWYEENIDNESTFLLVYFAEEDTDNDVGYMCYISGKQIGTVMDDEAVDIFWAYLDSAWVSDLSTDDMIVTAFTETAERIMKHTTTALDILKWVVIFAGVALVIFLLIRMMKLKRQHDKEANEETERILNTPLDTKGTEEDLVDKYTKN